MSNFDMNLFWKLKDLNKQFQIACNLRVLDEIFNARFKRLGSKVPPACWRVEFKWNNICVANNRICLCTSLDNRRLRMESSFPSSSSVNGTSFLGSSLILIALSPHSLWLHLATHSDSACETGPSFTCVHWWFLKICPRDSKGVRSIQTSYAQGGW